MIIAGNACRLKVATILAKQFSTPALADKYYNTQSPPQPNVGNPPSCDQLLPEAASVPPPSIPPCAPPLGVVAPVPRTPLSVAGNPLQNGASQIHFDGMDPSSVCKQAFVSLEPSEQLNVLVELFSLFMRQTSSAKVLPADFVELAVKACTELVDRM